MPEIGKVTRYCICGGAMTGRTSPPDLVEALIASFDRCHQGGGHGPATRQQASAARRREERQLQRSRKDW